MHIEDGMTVQQKAGEKVAPIDFPGNFSRHRSGKPSKVHPPSKAADRSVHRLFAPFQLGQWPIYRKNNAWAGSAKSQRGILREGE